MNPTFSLASGRITARFQVKIALAKLSEEKAVEKREKNEKSVIKTEKSRLKRWFSAFGQRVSAVFIRPAFALKLKGESRTIYPSMSRREIRAMAAAICKSALQNAEKK